MRKKYFYFVCLSMLFFSCSSNEPETLNTEPVFLEEDILGQWAVEYNEEEASYTALAERDYAKHSSNTDGFRVLTLVFQKNSEYHLVHNKGYHSGNYEIGDDSSVLLLGLGSLQEIEINEGKISATLKLDKGSEHSFSANFRSDYKEGDCISFLECYNDKYWLRRYMPFPEEDAGIVYHDYLSFKNNVSGVWWKKVIINQDAGCIISSTNNLLENAEFTILAHSSKLLIFRKETTDEALLYKYFFDEKDFSGGLHLQIVNLRDSGTTSYRYVSRENEENPVFEEYPECELKEDRIYVPDDVFEQRLIKSGLDDVLDNYVFKSQAEGVTELNLNVPLASDMEKIQDLTGIEGFVNLQKLNVENNKLTQIDISALTELEQLNLNKNQLPSLDCSANNKLSSLEVEGNMLIEINVSNSPDLWNLELRNNQLQKIDLLNNIELTDLMLGNNELSSIDLSQNINLWDLTINDNHLTALDLSYQKELWYLGASNNQLSDIDLTGAASLQFLALNNNPITEIDLTGLKALQEIYIENNQLRELVLTEKPQMYLIYAEGNQLSSLDVSSLPHEYLHVRVRNNALSCIKVNTQQLENHSNWQFDEGVVLSRECE